MSARSWWRMLVVFVIFLWYQVFAQANDPLVTATKGISPLTKKLVRVVRDEVAR